MKTDMEKLRRYDEMHMKEQQLALAEKERAEKEEALALAEKERESKQKDHEQQMMHEREKLALEKERLALEKEKAAVAAAVMVSVQLEANVVCMYEWSMNHESFV